MGPSRILPIASACVWCAENELCNCEFSLAYGGKILLQDARLRLVRGRRYGLCGANGVGKVRGWGRAAALAPRGCCGR